MHPVPNHLFRAKYNDLAGLSPVELQIRVGLIRERQGKAIAAWREAIRLLRATDAARLTEEMLILQAEITACCARLADQGALADEGRTTH